MRVCERQSVCLCVCVSVCEGEIQQRHTTTLTQLIHAYLTHTHIQIAHVRTLVYRVAKMHRMP